MVWSTPAPMLNDRVPKCTHNGEANFNHSHNPLPAASPPITGAGIFGSPGWIGCGALPVFGAGCAGTVTGGGSGTGPFGRVLDT